MIAVKAVTAYTALCQLMDLEWDFQTAYELLQIKRKLQPHAEFFVEAEQQLMLKYAAKDDKGNVDIDQKGTFTVNGAENVKRYKEERAALGMVEVQYSNEPVQIRRPEKIKPVMIEALEGVIEFI